MKQIAVSHLSNMLGVAFGTSGVRGLVDNLTSELCFAYVESFLSNVCPSATRVAIGIDLRPSSPSIAKGCVLSAKLQGLEVVFCGGLPTPALAYYAMQNKIPAIMITGSHIPFDRNGIKFYRENGEITKEDELHIMAGEVVLPADLDEMLPDFVLPDINMDAMNCFKKRYTDVFPVSMLKGKRIGVYEHSSVARDLIKELLIYFGAEVLSLGRTNTFVPIDTEAVSNEDQQKGIDWAKEFNLDSIISTDGDGDRPLIADENGHWLRGDILGVLCSKYLEATHVAAPINVNTVLERQDLARKTVRTKIGSPYVIAGMESLLNETPDARVVGYEANGGFMVGGDFTINGCALYSLPTRDSILPVLIVLAMSSLQKCPVSLLTADFPSRYTLSDRIKNIPNKVCCNLIDSLKSDIEQQNLLLDILSDEGATLNIASFDETDGLRITLNNYDVFHLRPSGNAPELRIYVETYCNEKAQNMIDGVVFFCREYL